MKNTLKACAITLAILLTLTATLMFIWFVVSYIQVLMLNLTNSPDYPNWNLFTYLLDLFA